MSFGGFADDDDDSFVHDINVTPLVDVALVLLFIFMVTAPLLMTALKVDVPEVATAAPAAATSIVIVLDAEGSIAVDNHVMTLEDAVALASKRAGGGHGDVYLRADRAVPYGLVASVLDGLRRAGVGGVGLVVQPIPAGEEAGAKGRH